MSRIRLFGLVIDSKLDLEGFPEAPDDAATDVTVRLGPEAPEDTGHFAMTLEDDPRAIVLDLESSRYRVTGGDTIEVQRARGADDLAVRSWLTGAGMCALLVQRGHLALHGNAVALPHRDGIAAFLGPTGAGKSTLALQFARAGLDLYCDDLIALDRLDPPVVLPGIPRVKLWGETLTHFDLARDGLRKITAADDKFELPTTAASDPASLVRVYLLEQAAPGTPPSIERVRGLEAASLIVDNVFGWRTTTSWHSEEWVFERCLALAGSLDVYRFVRPWSLAQADAAFALLFDHLST